MTRFRMMLYLFILVLSVGLVTGEDRNSDMELDRFMREISVDKEDHNTLSTEKIASISSSADPEADKFIDYLNQAAVAHEAGKNESSGGKTGLTQDLGKNSSSSTDGTTLPGFEIPHLHGSSYRVQLLLLRPWSEDLTYPSALEYALLERGIQQGISQCYQNDSDYINFHLLLFTKKSNSSVLVDFLINFKRKGDHLKYLMDLLNQQKSEISFSNSHFKAYDVEPKKIRVQTCPMGCSPDNCTASWCPQSCCNFSQSQIQEVYKNVYSSGSDNDGGSSSKVEGGNNNEVLHPSVPFESWKPSPSPSMGDIQKEMLDLIQNISTSKNASSYDEASAGGGAVSDTTGSNRAEMFQPLDTHTGANKLFSPFNTGWGFEQSPIDFSKLSFSQADNKDFVFDSFLPSSYMGSSTGGADTLPSDTQQSVETKKSMIPFPYRPNENTPFSAIENYPGISHYRSWWNQVQSGRPAVVVNTPAVSDNPSYYHHQLPSFTSLPQQYSWGRPYQQETSSISAQAGLAKLNNDAAMKRSHTVVTGSTQRRSEEPRIIRVWYPNIQQSKGYIPWEPVKKQGSATYDNYM